MKTIISLLALIITLSSCTKEDAPLLVINMEITESTTWKSAAINTGDISLITSINDTLSRSLIQQFDGININTTFSDTEKKSVGEFAHTEVDDVVGLRPYFIIKVTDQNDQEYNVQVDRNLYIPFPVEMDIVNDATYYYDIKIDADQAFLRSDDTIILNYEGLSTSISEVQK